jgi:hypothetical protein
VQASGQPKRRFSSREQATDMTVLHLATAGRTRGALPLDAYRDERAGTPRDEAAGIARSVHNSTAPLLAALEGAVSAAAADGANDTGARRVADALRDARIALDLAVLAAGRALADREVHLRPASG